MLVNTDAHSVRNFGLLPYGIATARRAWLTPEQVANTRPWAEFAPLRKRAALRRRGRRSAMRRCVRRQLRSRRADRVRAVGAHSLALGEAVELGDVALDRVLGQPREQRAERHQRRQPARAGDDAAAALDPAHDGLGGALTG